MKTLRFVAGLLAIGLISTGVVQAYDVNKDLQNLANNGAAGVKVVLAGNETITETYDGYADGSFNAPATGSENGNTTLTWTGFNDGGDNLINQGQVIHVGWSTSDNTNAVVKMVWTDAQGNELPGEVKNVVPEVRGFGGDNVGVTWRNRFSMASVINIRNVNWFMVPARVPLADINARNTDLYDDFMPLPGGTAFDLAPGASVTLMIPQPVPQGFWVVLRYEVLSIDSQAEAIDFVQFTND